MRTVHRERERLTLFQQIKSAPFFSLYPSKQCDKASAAARQKKRRGLTLISLYFSTARDFSARRKIFSLSLSFPPPPLSTLSVSAILGNILHRFNCSLYEKEFAPFTQILLSIVVVVPPPQGVGTLRSALPCSMPATVGGGGK